MKRAYLLVAMDDEVKSKLKDRAHELKLDGGMNELIRNLIDRELGKLAQEVPADPQPQQSEA